MQLLGLIGLLLAGMGAVGLFWLNELQEQMITGLKHELEIRHTIEGHYARMVALYEIALSEQREIFDFVLSSHPEAAEAWRDWQIIDGAHTDGLMDRLETL